MKHLFIRPTKEGLMHCFGGPFWPFVGAMLMLLLFLRYGFLYWQLG